MERKKYLDKIYDAYYMTTPLDEPNIYRDRTHWVCKQVSGNTILDIGCSQGITCILLGREAKSIIGIDVEKESIDFAQNALLQENESTRSYVKFQCVNMFEYKSEIPYDTVILGEVLEHLVDPCAAIKLVASFLKSDGVFVCTIPYGINDFPDHKHTYYQLDIIRQLETYFEIIDISFIHLWLGIVCKLRNERSKSIDFNEKMLEFEKYFYSIERQKTNKIFQLNNQLNIIQEEIKKEKILSINYKTELDKKQDEIITLENSFKSDKSKLDMENTKLSSTITEKLKIIQILEDSVEEKTRSIKALESVIADKTRSIQIFESAVAEKTNNMQIMETTFKEMLNEINESVEEKKKLINIDLMKYNKEIQDLNDKNKKILASIRYRIGDKIVVTMKNPLKIFLWPKWLLKMVYQKFWKKR